MAIAWLFVDEHTEGTRTARMRFDEQGAIVPSLFRLEVANMLRTAVRRGRCDDSFVDQAIAIFSRLLITIDPETDDHAWGTTFALSRVQGLTVYDAAYLELALRTGSALASCDGDLVAAARRQGVTALAG